MQTKGFLIANAHIDPVWLWDVQEGRTEVRNTFRSALDRLQETGGWVFTSSSAQFYAWVEETDPAMFEEIRARVREGRWCIAGGWWVQPDCDLADGESYCRQSLYGQRYFLQKFGVAAVTGYNVDSFGHAAGLPQILYKSGLKNYVFSRPGAHERDLPPLFFWESEDGSRVRAARIPIGYESNSLPELREKADAFDALCARSPVPQMLFFGVGNHGGGPTKEMLAWLGAVRGERGYEFVSVDEYFRRTKSCPAPRVRGDLGKHAAGCYSAEARIKTGNRRAENALLTAEKYACLAHALFGGAYPRDKLEEAWKRVLFYQFHDSLSGCAVKSVCDAAAAAFGAAVTAAGEVTDGVLQKIAARVDTCGGLAPEAAKSAYGKPVVVFNPHAEARVCTVRAARLALEPEKRFRSYEAVAPDGSRLPVQLVQSGSSFWYTRDGIFRAEVPAFGYRLFYIREGGAFPCVRAEERKEQIPPHTVNARFGSFTLENEHLRAEFGREDPSEMRLCRKGGAPLVLRGMRFAVDEDKFVDTWGHAADGAACDGCRERGVWSYCNDRLGEEIGRFTCEKLYIAECGPVRSVLRGIWKYGASELSCDFILYADADHLQADIRVRWAEKQKTARWVLPVAAKYADCDRPYGHCRAAADGTEEFAQKWIDVGGKEGLTIANDGASSYRLTGKEVSAVLARSAIYADHGGVKEEGMLYEYQDGGAVCHSFLLRPRGKADLAAAASLGLRFNTPSYCIWEGYHGGTFPAERSFLQWRGRGVQVRAVKRAEEGGGYVVRAFETRGKPCAGTLRLFGRAVPLRFAPYELKTVFVADDGAAEECDILERRGHEQGI